MGHVVGADILEHKVRVAQRVRVLRNIEMNKSLEAARVLVRSNPLWKTTYYFVRAKLPHYSR